MEERDKHTRLAPRHTDWAPAPTYVPSRRDGFLDLCQVILSVGQYPISVRVCAYMSCVQSLDSLRAVVMGERPYGSASQIPPLGGAFAYEGGETPTATAIVAEWHRNQLPGCSDHVSYIKKERKKKTTFAKKTKTKHIKRRVLC
jgi:hypothetical protein